jgi:hypothetical protein
MQATHGQETPGSDRDGTKSLLAGRKQGQARLHGLDSVTKDM